MFITISKKMMVAAVAAMMLVTMHAGVARADDDDARFEGTIESLPASGLVGDWVVAGQTVHVTSGTEIDQDDGPAVVGARVEVRGQYESDGSVTADEIEVERAGDDNGGGGDDGPNDDEIHGVVESLPASGLIGDWVVSGRVVHVSASTSIEQEHGAVAVGASVEVHGIPQSDGSLDATRIEVNPTGGNGGGSSPTGGHAKFFGTVESLPADGLVGLWMVSSRAVHVTASTVVEREHNVTPAVGSYVEVEGSQLQDGSIQASKVEVKTGSGGNDDNGGSTPGSGSSSSGGYAEIRAKVDALPASGMVGEWTVGGRTVFVTEATRIKQKRNRPIAAGSTVEVRGNQRADGSIDANRIEAKSSRGGSSSGGGRGTSSFYGTIEALPVSGLVGEWVVAGRAVVVTGQTFVDQEHGQARLGALVEVKGSSQADGSFVATKVEIKDGSGTVGSSGYIEFYGTVESLPASGLVGEWMVSGRRVFVTAGTTIREKHGPVRVGIRVEIEGNQRSDGSVDARKVGTED